MLLGVFVMTALKIAVGIPEKETTSFPLKPNSEGESNRAVTSGDLAYSSGGRPMSHRLSRAQAPKAKPQSHTLRNDLILIPKGSGIVLSYHKVFGPSLPILTHKRDVRNSRGPRGQNPNLCGGPGLLGNGWMFLITCSSLILSFCLYQKLIVLQSLLTS